jgi:glycosyltransferase involved in cell wall biosynthesis
MKILWLTWKDREHPLAGGAEVVNEELAKRLVRDGHEVKFVVGGFAGGATETTRDGFSIVRVGGRVSVYWKACRYYKQHLQGWADQVIDEVNTIPFFARWYVKEPVTLFIHQLAREIWFFEMFFPLNVIGYLIEPIYLWLLRHSKVITVSESTKRDLSRYGFNESAIEIISEGIECVPLERLENIQKEAQPTMLAFGSVRAMKRTLDIVQAFEVAKQSLPQLRLFIAGGAEGKYGSRVLEAANRSRYAKDITYLGRVSQADKPALLQRVHVIAVASVREGWGLVVTEANSQGTPAVVYDVPGLRDSVKNGMTGIVCRENSPAGMAKEIVALLQDQAMYKTLQRNGWEWSKGMTFEKAYEYFIKNLV